MHGNAREHTHKCVAHTWQQGHGNAWQRGIKWPCGNMDFGLGWQVAWDSHASLFACTSRCQLGHHLGWGVRCVFWEAGRRTCLICWGLLGLGGACWSLPELAGGLLGLMGLPGLLGMLGLAAASLLRIALGLVGSLAQIQRCLPSHGTEGGQGCQATCLPRPDTEFGEIENIQSH